MKSHFAEFYGYSNEDFKSIWIECLFVFDANVLLNLYRYTDPTRNQLIYILEQIKDRIWLPYQVALEYQFNRKTVIRDQLDSYDNIVRSIEKKSSKIINELNDELNEYKKRHPRINVSDIIQNLEKSFEELVSDIKTMESDHPDYLQGGDEILDTITSLFSEKIGESYKQTELDKIYKEGEIRYKSDVPPGYEDGKKKKGKKKFFNNVYFHSEYGDLILWNQILDESKKQEKPVIFITDDAKEDWWEILKGNTVGPRIELLNEFKIKTGQHFYMYKTDRFMNYVKDYLNEDINPKAIQEIKDYRESKKYEVDNFNLYSEIYGREFPYLTNEDWEQFEILFEENDHDIKSEEVLNWVKNKNLNRKIYNSMKQGKSYAVGDFVKHIKWGVGEVIKAKGEGRDLEITVQFPNEVGKKRLLAHFAPLDKIEF